jgi:hypothetical protein
MMPQEAEGRTPTVAEAALPFIAEARRRKAVERAEPVEVPTTHPFRFIVPTGC